MTRSSPHDSRVSIRGDNRAVSEVIGFILLFGLLIAGASIIQTYGIPAQNERVEFDHNLRVQEDIVRLSDGVETSGLTGAPVSATVEAGTDYPNRLFFFNPSSPSGALRTGDPLDITITNATATGEIRDYWDGSDKTFTTRPITYTPNYNVYRSAPTTIVEHGVVYNDNPNGQATMLKRGSFIRGDRISLVTVDGTFNRGTSQSLSVDAVPISAPSNSITLSPTQPLDLTIESSLSVADWDELLADEKTPNGHIQNITSGPAPGSVTISLEANVSYKLRMARIGLESGYDESASQARYLTVVGGRNRTVPEGSSNEVTFEVRDAFNNPVSNVEVNATTRNTESTVSSPPQTTGSDGQVTFTYKALEFSGSSTRADQLNVALSNSPVKRTNFNSSTTANVSVGFSVINSDSSGVQVQTGTGQGGESDWSTDNDTQQVTVVNGRWNNINSSGSIRLSDGEMVTTERCETKTKGASVFNECSFVDTLRLSFSLSNDKLSYVADVNLVDCNQDGEFNGYKCELSNQVSLYDNSTVTLYNTTGSMTDRQSLTLSNEKAKRILSTTGLDLLNTTSYEQTTFTNVAPADLKIKDATWLTGLMEGRVTVAIEESTT